MFRQNAQSYSQSMKGTISRFVVLQEKHLAGFPISCRLLDKAMELISEANKSFVESSGFPHDGNGNIL